jgi:histidinol phosphatase-like enzyme
LLDRDGTLIVERDYLSDPVLAELEKGVIDGCANWAGRAALVVLTNQSLA